MFLPGGERCSMKKYEHGGRVFAVARQLGIPQEELTDFSASINPLGPPSGVREAVATAFDRLGHYPDNDCTDLATALARRHGCTPANVCVANGSAELIYLLPRLVPGSRALLIVPTFSEYGLALDQAGWQKDYLVLPVESGFPLLLDLLRQELAKGYDMLFLCNPGNPTGRLYPPDEVGALVQMCREAGTFVVIDEAFMDFCEESSVKQAVMAGGCGLVLRSMTKFYAIPGLRLGYALAEASLTARLAALRPPWSVNTLAQQAGLAALADGGYGERSLALIAAGRAFMTASLAKLPGLRVFPGAANYLLVELTNGLTTEVLQERLLHKRLLIRNCAGFVGLNDRFFRIAVRTQQENERLLAALAGECVP